MLYCDLLRPLKFLRPKKSIGTSVRNPITHANLFFFSIFFYFQFFFYSATRQSFRLVFICIDFKNSLSLHRWLKAFAFFAPCLVLDGSWHLSLIRG